MISDRDQKLSDALARYEAFPDWKGQPDWPTLVIAVREWDVARRAGAGVAQSESAAKAEVPVESGPRVPAEPAPPRGHTLEDAETATSPGAHPEPEPPTATPPKCGRMVVVEVHVGTSMPCVRDRGHDGPCDWMSSQPTAPPTAAPAEIVPPYHALPGPTYDKDPRPSEDIIREIRDAGTPLNVWHQRFLDEERNRRNADTRLVAMRDERDDARAQLAEAQRLYHDTADALTDAEREAQALRVSDADVARIVARTPVEFECDATAYENLALDLRDARAQLAEVQRLNVEAVASALAQGERAEAAEREAQALREHRFADACHAYERAREAAK